MIKEIQFPKFDCRLRNITLSFGILKLHQK